MDWDLFIITFLTGLSYGVILTACSVYLLVAAQKMKGVNEVHNLDKLVGQESRERDARPTLSLQPAFWAVRRHPR